MSEKKIDGKLMIVKSAPGSRDFIYVGYTTRVGDMLYMEKVSMVVRYEEVGVQGIADQPEKAVILRPSKKAEWVPLSSIAGMTEADPEAWANYLGRSIG